VSTQDVDTTIRNGCKSFEEFCEMNVIGGKCKVCLPVAEECFKKLMEAYSNE
jgi:bacterioferritin-associated ferredoxin